jgi:type 1 glutamine amidotransferase
MSVQWKSMARAAAVAGAAAIVGIAPIAMKAQAPPPGAQAPGGGGGRGGSPLGGQLFTAFDADKDGSVTAAELKTVFDGWYDAADTQKSGSVSQEQLSTALNAALGEPAAPAAGAPGGRGAGGAGAGRGATEFVAGASTPGLNDACGGRSQQPTAPCVSDVEQMMAALPTTAPAKPAKARKVLIFSRIPSAGFQHSSIPLAAKAVEELGKKTGAWTSDTSWDPAVFTTENLKQYDAIFLSSTTGCFLDKAGDKAATDARRAAFIEFVRSGKGVAGIHATGDSYHSPCPNDEGAGAGRGGRGGGNGAGGTLASVILRWSWGINEKKLQANDLTMTKADMEAVSAAWYKQLDPGNSGKVAQAAFMNGIVPVATQTNQYVGTPGRDNGRGSWPDWDTMIGGWFKFHWLNPQHIVVKIDDKASPLTKMFNGQDFDVYDETYTFSINSFSRENVHVLTSINYDKMSFLDKLKESSPRPDHDFGLSWIKRDGQGRVFYMALGHDERMYAIKPMMEHLLAGMQYAVGDLKADDAPSKKK